MKADDIFLERVKSYYPTAYTLGWKNAAQAFLEQFPEYQEFCFTVEGAFIANNALWDAGLILNIRERENEQERDQD